MNDMSGMEFFDGNNENVVGTADVAVVKTYDNQRKVTNAIGWRFAVMGFAVIAVQIIAGIVLGIFAPEFYENNIGFVSLLLTLFSFDVVGVLTIFALSAKMEKTKLEKKKMSFGHLVLAIFISAGFCGIGSIVGTIIHMLLTLPFGSSGETDLAIIMLNSSMWLRVLVVGICAPVFEELIFRKLLIDRTVKYGEFFAIFLSGIFFGLFHGNFSQFFFATMLGFFFAYIYIKTGNVVYTIILHMVINMTSSVITTVLAADYMEAIGDGSQEAIMQMLATNPLPFVIYLCWLGFLGMICFVGVIIFIVSLCSKKYRLSESENAYKKGKSIKASIFNVGFLLFFAVTLILFANSYILPAIQYFVAK